MFKRVHVLTAGLAIMCATYLFCPAAPASGHFEAVPGLVLIAHAGGGLEAGSYSNSLEAFDAASARGFSHFEADFNWSGDGQLVLVHDWDRFYLPWFTPVQRLPAIPGLARLLRAPTPEAFKARRMRGGLTPMTASDLAHWMDAHPQARIVTDIKERNVEGLGWLRKHFGPHRAARLIPQTCSTNDYNAIRALGFRDIIFTTYCARISDAALNDFLRNNDVFALTLDQRRLAAWEAGSLRATGTPVFTHTINDVDEATRLREAGVAGLYTDYLYPHP